MGDTIYFSWKGLFLLMRVKIFWPGLLAVLWLALGLGMTGEVAASQENYVLGPEDEIEIKVWDHDDLTRKLRVGLDGSISFPFIGHIKTKGLTLSQLQNELQRRLGDGYIVDPHVSITITEYKSQRFFVVGNVARPGTYPLTKNITVVEAISLAGGVASGGSGGKSATIGTAIIVRSPAGAKAEKPLLPEHAKPQDKLVVSLTGAMTGDPRHNVEIKNGDTIYVPALVYFVTGEVKKPGRYPYEEGLTILQAVTTAEGFTDKAAPKRTHIIREHGQVKEKIAVKLDDPIRPGDTIVVPEAWF